MRCAESGALRKVEPRQKEVASLETGATRWSQSVKAANACRETQRCGECRARHEELGGRLPPGIGAVQDPGTDVDALVEECAELHKAADGAHQVPNYGEAPVVSLCESQCDAMESATRDGGGEAEAKGDTAACKPSGGKPSVDDSDTLDNGRDNDDCQVSECRDGNGCERKLGDQEVGHSFATVGKFLARFYCQDSCEYWHTDNMLSSQQFGSPRRAELLSGRSAGMAGCVFVSVYACLCLLAVPFSARNVCWVWVGVAPAVRLELCAMPAAEPIRVRTHCRDTRLCRCGVQPGSPRSHAEPAHSGMLQEPCCLQCHRWCGGVRDVPGTQRQYVLARELGGCVTAPSQSFCRVDCFVVFCSRLSVANLHDCVVACRDGRVVCRTRCVV